MILPDVFTLSPPLDEIASVPVPLPMVTLFVPVAERLEVGVMEPTVVPLLASVSDEVNPPFKPTCVVVVAPRPVTDARVEVSAIVTWPLPLLVVEISVPAANVTVLPWAIEELDPVVAASVKRVPVICPAMTCPDPLTTVVPPTERAEL